jgi:hypothetical protein
MTATVLAVLLVLLLACATIVCYVDLHRERRRRRYIPASICREGSRIRRGLTAVEAAVLLDVPQHRILGMVVFGLARDGRLRITEPNPLRVELTADPGDPTLSPLEARFLRAFRVRSLLSVERMRLRPEFEALRQEVTRRVSGSSLSRTRDHYRSLADRAWDFVTDGGDLQERFRRADRNLEWLMIEDDWVQRLHALGDAQRHYQPWWWTGSKPGTYTTSGFPMFGVGKSAPEFASAQPNFIDEAAATVDRLGRHAPSIRHHGSAE